MTSNKLTEAEKKVLTGWGTALIIIIVVLLIINHFFPLKTVFNMLTTPTAKEQIVQGEVSNFTRYSTVSAAISKMYSQINAGNYEEVVQILNEKYVEKNKITAKNVDEFIYMDDKALSFVPNIMYMKKVKKGVYSYYVDGSVVYSNTGEFIEKVYYSVTLDGNTFLFNVLPLTEKEYKEVSNEYKG